MKETFERIYQTMQDLGIDWQMCTAVCILAVLLFFAVWLLLRKLKLWYWKVDAQVDALNSIGVHLQELEHTVKEVGKFHADQIDIADQKGVLTDDSSEAASQEPETGDVEDEQALKTAIVNTRKFTHLNQGISKSGTVYTEQQLLEWIKD